MQIAGTREFFSKIASLSAPSGAQGSGFSPSQTTARMRTDTDSFLFSDASMKLSLNAKRASALVGNHKTEERKVSIKDPLLKIADDGMSRVMSILGEMHKLAVTAQKEDLEDLDRVNMQIEMESLRERLKTVPGSMWSQSRGESPVVPYREASAWGENDGTSLLDRMRERIMKGQEWDVREAWNSWSRSSYVEDDDGGMVVRTFEEGWYVVDDRSVMTTRERKSVDTGAKVPTVREILENETPVVLMDAESAAAGAKRLEQQMESVQRWRGKIAEFDASQQADSSNATMTSPMDILNQAADFISKIDKRISFDERGSLNRVTSASYFVTGDVLHDVQYWGQVLVPGDNSGDMTLDETESDEEKFKSKTASVFEMYDGREVLLSEDLLTGNIEFIKPVYVHVPPVTGHFFGQAA